MKAVAYPHALLINATTYAIATIIKLPPYGLVIGGHCFKVFVCLCAGR